MCRAGCRCEQNTFLLSVSWMRKLREPSPQLGDTTNPAHSMPRAYHVFLKSKSVLFLPQCHGVASPLSAIFLSCSSGGVWLVLVEGVERIQESTWPGKVAILPRHRKGKRPAYLSSRWNTGAPGEEEFQKCPLQKIISPQAY